MISIIGCGNRNRSDDGVGPYVIDLLQMSPLGKRSDIALYDAGTAGMDVMFRARGSRELIVIDAVLHDSPPGAQFIVPAAELTEDFGQDEINLHAFRWQHALYAGKKIFAADFPPHAQARLISAASTDFGLDLSPAVEASARALADQLCEEYREMETA